MNFLGQEIKPLGMGCWPIGGAMYFEDGSLGYTNADDAESIRTIHAALDQGITLFDTAAAYGAGHAERLLGRALKNRTDVQLVTKIGIEIDEATKHLTFGDTSPERVMPAIEACLSRLERDCIDLVLIHDNALPVPEAEAMFDQMARAREVGKIRAFGWSTDFSQSVAAVASRSGFEAVEHAMNVFVDVPRIQTVARDQGLAALIRSPLAMGLLTGKYSDRDVLPSNDIRAGSNLVIDYFKGARANPEFLQKLDAIRDLLTVGGRSLVQGAIGWLWAKGEMNIPIPGARTVEQIEGIGQSLEFGPLPPRIMDQIEGLIDRSAFGDEDREL